jgi:hypothetical protein
MRIFGQHDEKTIEQLKQVGPRPEKGALVARQFARFAIPTAAGPGPREGATKACFDLTSWRTAVGRAGLARLRATADLPGQGSWVTRAGREP